MAGFPQDNLIEQSLNILERAQIDYAAGSFRDEMKDLESLRISLDKSITLFHLKKAKRLAKRGLVLSMHKRMKSLEYFFKAQIFIIEYDFRKALNYLNLSLRENPGDCFSLNDKGICLAELGRLDEALIYFNKAIKIFADYPGFYQNKGWLLTLKGDYRGALVYPETRGPRAAPVGEWALGTSPHRGASSRDHGFHPWGRRPDTLFSIGYCFEEMSEIKKAKHYYLRALGAVKGKSKPGRLEIEKALRRL